MKKINRIKKLIAVVMTVLLAAGMTLPAIGDELPLKVSVPDTVKGYTPCKIRIQSPCAGEAVLRLLDPNDNLWRVMRATVTAGENIIPWDGLGENLERMFAGPYRFDVTVIGEDGTERTATAKFEINGTTPTLVYALPSSETMYLDGSEQWFVELYVSATCTVQMEIRQDDKLVRTDNISVSYQQESVKVAGRSSGIYYWNGKSGKNSKNTLKPGDYTLTFRSKSNPDYSFTYPLHVEEGPCPVYAVTETGPVVPKRGMSDEEIWEIMMKPSVVIKGSGNGILHAVSLYAEPTTRSRVAGSVREYTQALEVLETGAEWTLVRAWNYKDSAECTGYIRTDKLQVVLPSTHYGVLIDKLYQTLTVYMDGKPVGTIPVSTGKPTNHQFETAAGAFLTNIRDQGGSFAQDGFRYEYPIRYHAGNFIHGLGYTRVGRPRDYSKNLPLLGQKATHGCVRVSSFVTEEGGINLFWIWTRLPYHTRVIILDDADTEVIDDEDQ